MKKLFLFLIFLISSTFIFLNCEKELQIVESTDEQSTTVSQKSNINYVSSVEIPQITSKLEKKLTEVDYYNEKHVGKPSSLNTTIDYNKIMEVVSYEGFKNYTFNLDVKNALETEFYNLIVPGGDNKPYIIKYIIDDEALSDFLANNRSFKYFRGKYKLFSFSKFFDIDGLKSTEDCPDEGNISGGGSNDGNSYTDGDSLVSDGGDNGANITTYFGSTFNHDQTGSYVYMINDSRTGEAISGPVVNSNQITISYTSGGVTVSQVIHVDVSTTNSVDVNANMDSTPSSGGNCTLVIRREGLDGGTTFEFRSVPCPDASNSNQERGKTTPNNDDCPDPAGETGVLPHPFTNECQEGYVKIGDLCYPECEEGKIRNSNGECIDKPCLGDPVKNPVIAPQKGASGIKGGMYGCNRFYPTRSCGGVKGSKKHGGVDIKTSFGDPIFATHDGNARLVTQYKKGKVSGAGHYVEITSTINDKAVKFLYFHLQKDNRKSGPIKAGDIIGYQGDSGNLKDAIKQGFAESHVHIKVKEGNITVDPNNYLGTNFDPNTGESIKNPNCN